MNWLAVNDTVLKKVRMAVVSENINFPSSTPRIINSTLPETVSALHGAALTGDDKRDIKERDTVACKRGIKCENQ